ncbi:hypothetical protein CTAYLR_010783 [Chrysophaeum taylorii]|uniref:Synapsin ATP-binding domain-containing protein n=1 Tax=Chrysophaeum taylorii TaxID=2483200 RepID=A0AAD7UHY9_9STRA|nr:hypothetical protein CTAYLR_010783 [Chrysophaeum taylorii]
MPLWVLVIDDRTRLRDYRNILYGLAYAGVSCVISAYSLAHCQERAVVYGELNRLRRELGEDEFPFGTARCAAATTTTSSTTARTLSLSNDYFTVEPFYSADYDIRLQRIGETARAYKRVGDSWKGNAGNARYEDLEVTDHYRRITDHCARLFGGLDILSVDLLHCTDGTEIILEMHDSATGLNRLHEKDDMLDIRDLTLRRVNEVFGDRIEVPAVEIATDAAEERVARGPAFLAQATKNSRCP